MQGGGGVQEAYVLMVDDYELQQQQHRPANMQQHTYREPELQHQHERHTVGNTSPPPQSASSHSKVQFLDGVRGLAAILVVAQHCGYLGGMEVGQCGVDVFFVLSAFLLTMLFYRKSAQLLTQQASYRKWFFTLVDYFSKRFFRVYPLFAIVAIVVYRMPNEKRERFFFVHDPERYDLYKVLTFEFPYRYHVFWTLPLEIAYYFMIPLVAGAVLGLRHLWWVPCVPLCYWIWATGWTQLRVDHQGLKPHLPTFVCGSLAAILYVKIDAAMTTNERQSLPPTFKWPVVAAIRLFEALAFALLLSEFFRGLLYDWFPSLPRPSAPRPHFISPYVTTVIVIEMLLPSWVAGVFEWNVLRYTGKISFSVYLLHSFVVYANPIREQYKYYNKLASQIVLIALLATASYHLVEYPCQLLSAKVSRVLAQWGGEGVGGSQSDKIQPLLSTGGPALERKAQALC
ncbi:Acyltransferase family [Globisporangium polare]